MPWLHQVSCLLIASRANSLLCALTCWDTTTDCRRFSSALIAETLRLISFLKACLAARRAAMLPLVAHCGRVCFGPLTGPSRTSTLLFLHRLNIDESVNT